MGIQNNTTSTIIVDAVLTDTGRMRLANNTFKIDSFALIDDEVDYGLIKKYGRVVGSEKIIKNTLVQEAITDPALCAKSFLITATTQNIKYMPQLGVSSVEPGNYSQTGYIRLSVSSTATNNSASYSNVVIKLIMPTTSPTTTIDPQMQDTNYSVEVDDAMLTVENAPPPLSIDSMGRARYIVTTSTSTSSTATRNTTAAASSIAANFRLQARPGIRQAMYDTYGDGSTIITHVRVRGEQSGAFLDIPVHITKND